KAAGAKVREVPAWQRAPAWARAWGSGSEVASSRRTRLTTSDTNRFGRVAYRRPRAPTSGTRVPRPVLSHRRYGATLPAIVLNSASVSGSFARKAAQASRG